jgi:hypothetical protein
VNARTGPEEGADTEPPVNTVREGGVVHVRAAQVHEDSAARHEAAAVAWDVRGNAPQAEFERRCAAREREFVLLEADRAELQRLRAASLSQEPGPARVDIERLSSEIRRRAAELGNSAVELDRRRTTLRSKQHRGDRHRDPARDIVVPDARERDEADDSPGHAEAQRTAADVRRDGKYAQRRVRQSAQSLARVFGRAAEVLEKSASLAEDHAGRQDRAGRGDAAAEERRVAARAREAAQRARLHAEECLQFGARDERLFR